MKPERGRRVTDDTQGASLPSGPPADTRAEPGIHYAYMGLAFLSYGMIAGWSYWHVRSLTKVLEYRGGELPLLSMPLFRAVHMLGPFLFAPLALLVVLEIAAPRRLTRTYLGLTLFLILAGIYVGIALWLPARQFARA